ncbi:proteinase [Dulcicalothrix desertica PCC 7102]|uniref:Proteinase n=1 Tax=Dulcicalothrix desertica PCC 7102 TaxID=232991 RepID=A0A3S1CN00_9CYAN|nr:proteinase [Dulcicalothrix desertica PCC 7102]
MLLSNYSVSGESNAASNQISNQVYTRKEITSNFKSLNISNPQKQSMNEDARKIVLENGLTVITKEVHTAPVVTVQVWYRIGSRNEEQGVNGIAHQLEHMMFKGTARRPIQFGRLFSTLGSDSNAFTSYDQTAYYNTVERTKLNALLELEADRMHNSLIDAPALASEKRVVISELQGYENNPEYRLSHAVMHAAFPDHPYGLSVGGKKSDVEKFTVEKVQEYYNKFYRPDNAVLVIVGDFQTESTIADVKRIFNNSAEKKVLSAEYKNGIRRDAINRVSTGPIILKEPGAASILQSVYPLPDIKHPDAPALDVMDYILSDGRNSRLYQALVDSGIATDVDASVASLKDFGWYEITILATPKQDLKKIDSIVTKVISKFTEEGVDESELKRAKAQFESSVILGNRDITSQAMQLGNDEVVTGNHLFMDNYLDAVRKVTAQDVQRVAKHYLNIESRTFGYFLPTQAPVIAKNSSSNNKINSNQTHESFTSSSGGVLDKADVLKYLPQFEAPSETLQSVPELVMFPNGLRVLMLPDKSTPTVTLSGYIKAGSEFDCDNKAGLSELVADNLLSGTKTKDVLQLAKALEERGASLDFNPSREGVRIEGDSLAEDLSVLLHTLADVIKNPTFPNRELELSRKHALSALEQDLDDPSEVARRTFVQSIYPKPHPLHKFPTKQSLRRITRKDVIDFKAKYYRPDAMVLALVGDFNPAEVKSRLKGELGDWSVDGKAETLLYPSVSMPDNVIRVNSVLPGKAQTITYMGNTAINRNDSRYYSALVLNQILGGDTLSSRLGAELRDRQGLTYGIFSNFLAGKNSGTFLIEMQTSPQDTAKAIASTRQLLQDIHKLGVTEQEVETAKRTVVSNYIVSLANPEELVHQILMNQVYGLDVEELRNFTEKINQVGLSQVNQAARELLNPDKIVVVTAGPAVATQGIQPN